MSVGLYNPHRQRDTFKMTPEELQEWVEEQLAGVQYVTPFGPVYCPERDWIFNDLSHSQWVKDE